MGQWKAVCEKEGRSVDGNLLRGIQWTRISSEKECMGVFGAPVCSVKRSSLAVKQQCT